MNKLHFSLRLIKADLILPETLPTVVPSFSAMLGMEIPQ